MWKNLWKQSRKVFIEISYFLSSKVFLLHFGIILLTTFLLLWITFWGIAWYSNHGQSLSVPPLQGMTLEQANDYIKGRDFKLFVADSVYVPGRQEEGGKIIEQFPAQASRVKPGRTIYLTIQTYHPPLVPISYSQVIGHPRAYVEKQLRNFDIHIKTEKWVPCRPDNTVTALYLNGQPMLKEVDPSKNEEPPAEPIKIPRGSEVELYICQDEATMGIDMPDLKCHTLQQALFQIAGHELLPGHISFKDEEQTDTVNCVVCGQSPGAGRRVSMGTGVGLTLCHKSAMDCE